MAKMRTEKMDRAHRPNDDGPQRGGIKGGSDAHQQQQQNPSREESGGIGRGELG